MPDVGTHKIHDQSVRHQDHKILWAFREFLKSRNFRESLPPFSSLAPTDFPLIPFTSMVVYADAFHIGLRARRNHDARTGDGCAASATGSRRPRLPSRRSASKCL